MAAESVARASRRVPEDLRPLIFASPVCARSSDVEAIWHPGYRNRHRLRLLFRLLCKLPLDAAKGFLRLFPPFRPLAYTVQGEISDRLLVVPLPCHGGNPYIASSSRDAIFVYGQRGETQMKIGVLRDILLPFVRLFRSVAVGGKGNVLDGLLLTLLWLTWLVSLRWLEHRALERTLDEMVRARRIRKLGCIHEMHAHARIVWSVARRRGAAAYTVQHAAFSRGKRWLFPHSSEISAGLPAPGVFYVYDEATAGMLRPHYPETKFILGHSHRYSSLRSAPVYRDPGDHYLFATALPWFDNAVVAAAFMPALPARFRLHPGARIPERTRRRLRKAGALTDAPLSADIAGAVAVIGMGSTVLLEALAYGRPVIQLTHPDFLDYLDIGSISGVRRIDRGHLCPDVLETAAHTPVDWKDARSRFGFDYPEVTYERLFSNE